MRLQRFPKVAALLLVLCAVAPALPQSSLPPQTTSPHKNSFLVQNSFLGFDRNDYPGDQALAVFVDEHRVELVEHVDLLG